MSRNGPEAAVPFDRYLKWKMAVGLVSTILYHRDRLDSREYVAGERLAR